MNFFAVRTLLVVTVLAVPVVALAAQDADADRSSPKTFVKDSVITTKIKSRLAAQHITSLGEIHVDTDESGIVWLRGNAGTQEAADKAVSIARETEGVTDVRSHIIVRLEH